MTIELTAKELRALKQACEVLSDLPTYIGDFGIDPYDYDCSVAKLNKQPKPDKSDYED